MIDVPLRKFFASPPFGLKTWGRRVDGPDRPVLTDGHAAMKISVLVTTHNRPAYLRKVLAGYLDQTRLPDELIVADDGSGAATRDLVDRFTRTAPFRVVHAWQPHAGMPRCSHVRNLGTRAATGDYLIYTDGDCVPTPHFVADHARLARPGWFVQGKRMWVKYKALARLHRPGVARREAPALGRRRL